MINPFVLTATFISVHFFVGECMSNMTVNAISLPSSQEKAVVPMEKFDGPPQSMKRARFLINDILSNKDEADMGDHHERQFSPANPSAELPKDLSFHRRSTCGDSSDYDDSESIKGMEKSVLFQSVHYSSKMAERGI